MSVGSRRRKRVLDAGVGLSRKNRGRARKSKHRETDESISPPKKARAAFQILRGFRGLLMVAATALACGMLIAAMMIWSGRDDTTSKPDDAAHVEVSAAAKSSPIGNDPLDPAGDGWQTEVFHTAAKHQLQEFGKLLGKRSQHNTDKLAAFASPAIVANPLRPGKLDTVYEKGPLRVDRKLTSVGENLRGLDGLAAAIESLARRFSQAEAIRCAFKIFRIDVRSDGVETVAYFQIFGRTSRDRVQANATWHCRWTRAAQGETPKLLSLRVDDYEESICRDLPDGLFTDCTGAMLPRGDVRQQLCDGVDRWCGRVDSRFGMGVAGPQGVAIGDADGDGLDDVFIAQQAGLPNRLLLQNSDGTTRDISAEANVDQLEGTRAALFLDLDNDGDQDLALAMELRILLLENDGQARFSRRAWQSAGQLFSLAAADYDNDGDLDLYACCFNVPGNINRTMPSPIYDANNGGENILLRNDGDWQFTDATISSGVDENNRRFSYAAAWEDYDNDGDQDLYVANDFGRNNLYRNDEGHFRDVAATAGAEDLGAGMSAAWGDANGDGLFDLYVGNMFSSAGGRIAFQPRFRAGSDETTRSIIKRHARGNSLFINNGDGTFSDRSLEAGVTMGRWAWGSVFVDINNDARQDLLVANGYQTGDRKDDL